MSLQTRDAKIFAALLISVTIGAIVLMVLGNNPPPAGAFCLSEYYSLRPIEEVVFSRAAQLPDHWGRIEIYYSGTKAGNIEQLASLRGLANPEDVNCHFVVCNGLGGDDGQIQSTERWQRQWSIIPDQSWYGSERTIRICVIADEQTSCPTNFQINRTEALTEQLSEKFNIHPKDNIEYPSGWR